MGAYVIPSGLEPREIAARLAALGSLDVGPTRTLRRTFLESFDWRLHQAGWMLEAIAGAHPALQLRPLHGGRPIARRPGGAVRFARDLPAGALRDRLVPVLEPRALLPLAVADVNTTSMTLRGVRGRGLLRLVLETTFVGVPGSEPSQPLHPLLVVPDGRRARRVNALCASWPDLTPAPNDRIAAALEPLGRRPRDYSGKIRVPLLGAMPARDAARLLLLHLLGTLEANLAGARTDVDPEFLHDLRVAVRRTRSAIGQIKGVLPPARLARFARLFARVQELTGPARDLDVYALELPALGALLPARARRSLGPLGRLLGRRRRAAHVELAQALEAPWFTRLLADWRTFLLLPTPRQPTGAPNARRPVAELASERIGILRRRALREGGRIRAASPPADLHELRKTCKKLRYLVEFFQSLLDPDEAAAAVATLKGLQDTLGEFQDLQVQTQALLGYARELAHEGQAPPPTFVALGRLIERLREQQARARQAFAERFGEFSSKASRKRWKHLLRTTAAAVPPSPAPEEAAAQPAKDGDG